MALARATGASRHHSARRGGHKSRAGGRLGAPPRAGFRGLIDRLGGALVSAFPGLDETVDLAPPRRWSKVTFTLQYDTRLGQELMVCGGADELGGWDTDKAVQMEWTRGGMWQASVYLPSGGVYFYKYVLREGWRTQWQSGANSMLVMEADPSAELVYDVQDMWSGESTEAAQSSQLRLVERLEDAESGRRMAEARAMQAEVVATSALQELIVAREEVARAQRIMEEKGWLAEAESLEPLRLGEGGADDIASASALEDVVAPSEPPMEVVPEPVADATPVVPRAAPVPPPPPPQPTAAAAAASSSSSVQRDAEPQAPESFATEKKSGRARAATATPPRKSTGWRPLF